MSQQVAEHLLCYRPMDVRLWPELRSITLLALLLSTLPAALFAADRSGTIKGTIVDGATKRPLPGANVAVAGRDLGAIAGSDGRFVVTGVPVGLHRLQVSMIGYDWVIRPDVVVRSRRITSVDIELAQHALGMEEIIVAGDYFSDVEEEAVSAVNFNYEEIRRSPGSAGDISRLLQAMPSVSMNTDQRNDLIVRGGSPAENLTIVDNIEIPNINHFPTQGASGGPIGLLNIDLIDDATFYAGGFSAAHGDRLSSVMIVDMREGNRDEFDGEANMSMAGAGFIFENPIRRGRGSWVLSARRSYLDLIVGAIGTGAVPEYSDIQGKVVYDISPAHKLSLLSISGFDHIDIKPDDADEEDFVVLDIDQHVLGGNWRWLWGANGYANTSLAITVADFGTDVEDGDTRRRLYENDSRERALVLRSSVEYSPAAGTALSSGLVARRVFSDYAIFADDDTNRIGAHIPEIQIGENITAAKVGFFISWQQEFERRFSTTLGARFDYFDLNEEFDLAPRLALTYALDEHTSLNAAAGTYYQNLPPLFLVQHPDNRELENPRADHFVLGLRRRLTPETLFTLEAYFKRYTELPYDPDDPTASVIDAFADFGSPTPGRLIGGGKADSKGLEALVQKKLARNVYGSGSYSYSISKYSDRSGIERNRSFDNRHLFSLILGYRPSDRFEYSVRWRYAGGRPHTPFDERASAELGTGIINRDRINAERLPPYHRLDLRFDYRKQYDRFNLVSFFTVLNTYNRANIFTFFWDEDEGRVDRIDQWSLLPVGGFEFEF